MMLGCGREVELDRGKEWAGCVLGILEGGLYPMMPCIARSRYCQRDRGHSSPALYVIIVLVQEARQVISYHRLTK